MRKTVHSEGNEGAYTVKILYRNGAKFLVATEYNRPESVYRVIQLSKTKNHKSRNNLTTSSVEKLSSTRTATAHSDVRHIL